MCGTGDIDGRQQADPVIDLLAVLAEVVTRAAPSAAPATSTDTAEVGPG
jgi:hypothetical protein